ncbi:tissue factor-like isoform X1 [Sebastes umbrosus]|uniref:tissue factor-like isoform X1 n=1 Tax=Sebastes umbrosus TaxID=72105 RepID=UPI00189D4247|nr:tissue factor-like isoform X1 [Sebastes umbrosus]
MASLKTVLYLGVCLSAWIITTADGNIVPKAENVRWVSLDFKTILKWTTTPSDYKYTVQYSSDNGDWLDIVDCIQVSGSECDLTNNLEDFDRTFTADVKTEAENVEYDYDELPHTYSPQFNPYKDSNISAVNFTVEAVDERTVIVNITDPLTGIHRRGKQLSLRDVFKKELNYKISYYKSESTNKRDNISESSTAEVSTLDAGQSYCFMVAASIRNRPESTKLGAWSKQKCTPGTTNGLQELSLGAWVGAVFILLTVLIIIVTVTVLCCRCCRQRNTSQQSSAPI